MSISTSSSSLRVATELLDVTSAEVNVELEQAAKDKLDELVIDPETVELSDASEEESMTTLPLKVTPWLVLLTQ